MIFTYKNRSLVHRTGKFIAMALVTFFSGSYAHAQLVSTNAELQSAIANATAGTTITLADKVWTNTVININATGTEQNPVTITGATPGAVFLEGNSRIQMGGEYIIFKDVIFQNAAGLVTSGGEIAPVINFRDNDKKECNHCIVTNVKIDTYNGLPAQLNDKFKWIIVYGQYNEISHSSFVGKHGIGSIINDNRNSASSAEPNFSPRDYTKIHHNYFASRIPVGEVNAKNDQDAIRIGNSKTSLGPSNTEIYDNFFYDWSGEIEIISNKSGENKYYHNTFRDYQGSLTLRHGDNCEVFDNYFIAEGNTFSGGIRVIGEGHKVFNNYIEGTISKKPSGSNSNGMGAINVSNGLVDTPLNGYYQVKNVTITNNTMVNCDIALRIGTKVKSTLSLAPENLEVANNITLNCNIKALQEVTAPIGTSSYAGNLNQNGDWDLTDGTNNNQTVTSDLLMETPELHRPTASSPAVDAGVGSYSFLTWDILGGTRPSTFDVGAEEFGANGIKLPYDVADVGTKVGFGSTNTTLSVTETTLKAKGIAIFPIPATNENLNIKSDQGEIGQVQVYSIQGKLLSSQNINTPNGNIKISNLTSGMYLIKIKNAFGRFLVN